MGTGYISKTGSSGLISVRLTDAGRKKLSQGQLALTKFQLGDSEFCYNCYTQVLTQSNGIFIIEPKWNSQNISNISYELNKMNVKYPIPLSDVSSAQTYGVLQPQPTENPVFNTARPRGFFSGNTSTSYSAITTSEYVYGANWCVPFSGLTGGSQMLIVSGACNSINYTPTVGDLIMVQYFGPYQDTVADCNESHLNIPQNNPVPYLFYNVVSATTNTSGVPVITSANTGTTVFVNVDRNIPDFTMYSTNGLCAKILIYPKGNMLNFYGADTPIPYWSPGSLSFDNNCDVSVKDVNVWNMNINWTQYYDNNLNWGTVAGTNNNTYEDVNEYGSSGYCGTKEYLGYNNFEGQFDSTNMPDYYGSIPVLGYSPQFSGTYVRDSFGNVRSIVPEDQRCIAVLHYTNETISNFYGEKFALMRTGEGGANGVGEMQNFKIHMPTLMWHKKKGGNSGSGTGTGLGDECTIGQTFYVQPPGYENVAQVEYIASTVNPDMNEPGIRYYHLWDDNLAATSGTTAVPNRVGKVFPDLQMITIDDQELVASMSYKSNRNWTLPMPKLELIPENTANCITPPSCTGGFFSSGGGVSIPNSEQVWISYLLESTSGYTTGLHCNYYPYIVGDTTTGAKDVSIQFGSEFPFLREYDNELCIPFSGSGIQVDKFHVLYQKTDLGAPPDPSLWSKIDMTSSIVGHTVGQPIRATGLTSTAFYLTCDTLLSASTYNLHDYINIPLNNGQEPNSLQFGDEYFFYGNLESDIMATIYEMRYGITLAPGQFTTSLNPSWDSNNLVRITEIGLYDNTSDLMAIAKLKNPTLRTGAQTFQIKIDF